jgi:hypothetical protein
MSPEAVARAERDLKIRAWIDAKSALETAKVNEHAARLEVARSVFPETFEGTRTIDLGGGYAIKCVKGFNYNLSESKKPRTPGMAPFATRKALNEIEKIGNEGPFIAERLVTWKPELSLTEYRDLDPQFKKIIDTALTISPALPSLEFVTPKGK